MRSVLAVATAVCLTAALAGSATAATKSIRVGDNWFHERTGTPTVTVRAGDKVTWRFRGESPHNVVVKTGPATFRSPVRRTGTYSRRVTRRGTYTIICTIHGEADQSMRLRVR